MSPDEAGQYISERLRVERADVAAIKAFAIVAVDRLIAESENDRVHGALPVETLARAWLRHAELGAPWSQQTATEPQYRPPGIDISSDSVEAQLLQCARALANVMATHEAVWELVQAGELLPVGVAGVWRPTVSGYQTSRGGGGISIAGPTSSHPERVMRPPSRRNAATGSLWDADLYLRDLPFDLQAGIAEALRQAVHCFRRDLFLPALAMLTSAVEGMWVQTGSALLGAAVRRDKTVEKLADVLVDDRAGLSLIVTSVSAAYARKDLFEAVHKSSGVRDLAAEQQWTDVVRDGRNVLHWRAETVTENTYSKVATLLQAAPLRFHTLSTVRRIALASNPDA